jgi:hypothetical protein
MFEQKQVHFAHTVKAQWMEIVKFFIKPFNSYSTILNDYKDN